MIKKIILFHILIFSVLGQELPQEISSLKNDKSVIEEQKNKQDLSQESTKNQEQVTEEKQTAQESTKNQEQVTEEKKKDKKGFLKRFNDFAFSILFFDISFGSAEEKYSDGRDVTIPFIVFFLLCGSIVFTILYKFVNVRLFKHGIDIVRGKYDKEHDKGDISHFRALTSALSGTVGLGNISSVAIAIAVGGPGAFFWMLCAAFLGMSAKFSSCCLAIMYRKLDADGKILGGPMYYLEMGLKELKMPLLGKFLGIMFASFIVLSALGGGNMYQANESFNAVEKVFFTPDKKVDKESLEEQGFYKQNQKLIRSIVYGVILASFVAIVILGGITKIGQATSKLIPLMCLLYVFLALYIILINFSKIDDCISLILSSAFTSNALYGGFFGTVMIGIQRAAFSNEAGMGSASIVHAAAKTDEPVREGVVAMLGPFIDTICICSLTALVVIITGSYENTSSQGVEITLDAFSTELSYSKYALGICIVLFAYSTIISWCYYGERGWIYLVNLFKKDLGESTVNIYRAIFVAFIVFGSTQKLADVLDFTDVMILSLALPNIIGSVLLYPKLKKELKDYYARYKENKFE